MAAIFLTRAVGAKELSDDDQDDLIAEIQECISDNDGALVLPEGWGVVISDDGRDVEYDEDEDGDDTEEDEDGAEGSVYS